ncbi:hypothetical protein [Stenoxybacter acetivorans]|nr:hypothetical protein [Stenoxybacter acetivorans]
MKNALRQLRLRLRRRLIAEGATGKGKGDKHSAALMSMVQTEKAPAH